MSLVEPERLNELCLRALLRCVRKQAGPIVVGSPRLSSADMEALRLYWALSDWVKDLATRVTEHPREAQEASASEEAVSHGEVLGLVDARATLLEQERTQNPCVYVGYDTTSTILSGPNHVVAWTLREAERSVSWAVRAHKLDDTYGWLSDRVRLLEEALRVHSLRDVVCSPMGSQRPGRAELRSAAKSTVQLYRLGLAAYAALESIEALHTETLTALFSQTLLAALQDWQRFELATAIAVTEAISEVSGEPIEMDLALDVRKPLARVGPYSIWWQLSQPMRPEQSLDESERLVKTLAESLGVNPGAGRADVSIRHELVTEPLTFLECKWFQSLDSLHGAIIEASEGLVRYARDAHPDAPVSARDLLSRCVAVVAARGDLPERLDCSGPVNLTDLQGLEVGALKTWAGHVVRSSSGQAAVSACQTVD